MSNDKILKQILSTLQQIAVSLSDSNYISGEDSIRLLGRSNVRDMKYIREHFLSPGDYRMKNGKAYEYLKTAILELKRKVETGRAVLPFSSKLRVA